jgi:hypothetical protein
MATRQHANFTWFQHIIESPLAFTSHRERYSWSLFSRDGIELLDMIWIDNFLIPSLFTARFLILIHPQSEILRLSPYMMMRTYECGWMCSSAQEVVEFQWQYFILMNVIATDVFLISLLKYYRVRFYGWWVWEN